MAAKVWPKVTAGRICICYHLSFPGCGIHDIQCRGEGVYPVRPVAVVAVALLE